MYTYFCLFFFISGLISQQSVDVLVLSDQYISSKIELELIENIFELYNKRESEPLNYKIVPVKQFQDFFTYLSVPASKNILSIGSITITKQRLSSNSFSIPYIPVKQSLIEKKPKKSKKSDIEKVGYIRHSIYELTAHRVLALNKYEFVAYTLYSELINALLSEEIDYMFSDNYDAWDDTRISIVKEFENAYAMGCGIMYPKGSELKAKLDPYISYYLKSKKFRYSVQKQYGKDIVNYFIKELKLYQGVL